MAVLFLHPKELDGSGTKILTISMCGILDGAGGSNNIIFLFYRLKASLPAQVCVA